jgi:glycosyltransferase involved in cell wall biosynthesis
MGLVNREASRSSAEPERAAAAVVWLAPRLPTNTTFLDRELAGLMSLGVDVMPVARTVGLGALRTLLRRPIQSIRLAARLQRLKARRDRERGRLGYLLLAVEGMTLADRLVGRASRVHATFADGVGTVAYCAAELARVPYTFTAHSPYSLWQGSRLLARQAASAERVFCISEDVEARLGRLAPTSRRTVVRCLGPSAPPERLPQSAPALLVSVGRPQALKGFATAIAAVARAVDRGADVRFEVIGEGPELRELERLAADLSLDGRVSFPGWIPNDDVLRRLSSSLALLAPSEVEPDGDRDGLPVSILDAAACGVPAIATAVSGIPEFVVDTETGIVVPEHDPVALAEAIVRLHDDRELAARLGEAARRRLQERHDPDTELSKLVRAWSLDGAGLRAPS